MPVLEVDNLWAKIFYSPAQGSAQLHLLYRLAQSGCRKRLKIYRSVEEAQVGVRLLFGKHEQHLGIPSQGAGEAHAVLPKVKREEHYPHTLPKSINSRRLCI